ncbi:unnamed protein product [Bursaphelenchus okinawaensis]|uniref:Uncharacterized protein n=1 Tax=Bursaphelenchus okinawaensis TaxID=465554 RepID=A0A811JZQ3_9BILA|nr:unnamed protein product [Bursaphelenchus okinawaensis]CAG9088426.1 unnamed protein product [Bursaphelenchus okinawaensis]
MFNGALCMNMLAVEQHLATVWVNDYEQKKIKIGVVLMLVAIVQSVPIGSTINWYYTKQDYDLYHSKTSCIPIDKHWELGLIGYALCFFTCGACSLIGYTCVDVYAIYHMFCFMYYNDAMRVAIRKDFYRIFGSISGGSRIHHVHKIEFNNAQHTNVYFQLLHDSWK